MGFDRLVIRPQVVEGLEQVTCSHRSIRGLIESNWTATEGEKRFEIVIPPDSTALVELPASPGDVLAEGGNPVVAGGAIEVLAPGASSHRLRLGSGRYHFTITK